MKRFLTIFVFATLLSGCGTTKKQTPPPNLLNLIGTWTFNFNSSGNNSPSSATIAVTSTGTTSGLCGTVSNAVACYIGGIGAISGVAVDWTNGPCDPSPLSLYSIQIAQLANENVQFEISAGPTGASNGNGSFTVMGSGNATQQSGSQALNLTGTWNITQQSGTNCQYTAGTVSGVSPQ